MINGTKHGEVIIRLFIKKLDFIMKHRNDRFLFKQTYRPHPWRPVLGFEATEVFPLPEQLVTNELVDPCYISSGMSTEPLRFPNLVTGFERNPQHAARTALNTRYTQHEWKNARAALNTEADSNLKQADYLLLESDRLLKYHYSTIGGQTSSGFRIGERITDTKNMRDELISELGKLIDEMKLLTDAKRDIEKALQVNYCAKSNA